MSRYPCKNCEERHFACWDRCDRYLAAKAVKIKVNEADMYEKAKGKYYKTEYGWRR